MYFLADKKQITYIEARVLGGIPAGSEFMPGFCEGETMAVLLGYTAA